MADDAKKTAKPKLAIPTSDFNSDALAAGSLTSAVKGASGTATKQELFDVPVESFRFIPDFNVRIETPDYVQHIEDIAQSIVANGFYRDKALTTYAGKDGDENVLYITDGHTRLRAVKRAIELGAEITSIPTIVKPGSESIEDLTVALVQANSGRPLSALEKAIVAKRLMGFGVTEEDIAKRLNCTPRYVSDLLVLVAAPPKVRNAVISGKMSATEAVKVLRKHGQNAAKVVEKATAKADGKGKKKATAKDIAAAEAETTEASGKKYTIDRTAATRSGKAKATLVYNLKAGAIIPKDEVKPILLVNDSDWWNYVDDNTKADIFVETDTKITVIIEQPVRDDTLDGLDESTGSTASQAGEIEDQTGGGEAEAEAPALDDAGDL